MAGRAPADRARDSVERRVRAAESRTGPRHPQARLPAARGTAGADRVARRFLVDRYEIRFGELHPWCTTALATPRIVGMPDVKPATPVLSMAWIAHDVRGVPVERSWVVPRGDRAHLTLHLPQVDQVIRRSTV
ncbi:hypothetical protein GCM10027200_75460 [Lentzea nigeriaca]